MSFPGTKKMQVNTVLSRSANDGTSGSVIYLGARDQVGGPEGIPSTLFVRNVNITDGSGISGAVVADSGVGVDIDGAVFARNIASTLDGEKPEKRLAVRRGTCLLRMRVFGSLCPLIQGTKKASAGKCLRGLPWK